MTIDEAIEVQTDYLENPLLNYHEDLRKSIELGIEALKRVRGCRLFPNTGASELLPGETE